MEDKPRLMTPMEKVLEHLLDKYPAELPPGSPEGIEAGVQLQFSLKSGQASIGNVRRSDIPGVYVAVVAQVNKGTVVGVAECWFEGSDIALIVRPMGAPEPSRVVAAGVGDLPPNVRIRP